MSLMSLRKFALVISSVLLMSLQAIAGKIVYCSDNGTGGNIQIFVMNEDGTGKKQLTNIQNDDCKDPEFSSDGKQIVFSTARGLIYLIRSIDKAAETEPYYLWNGYSPLFTPNGDYVIFENEFDGVLSVMIIDTAAGAEAELVSDGGYSNMPDMTPDGSKLVYSTFIDNSKSVVEVDMSDTLSTGYTTVSSNEEANIYPDISEDGSMITYASFDQNLKGTIRIFKGGKERPLTKGMPSSNAPKFSPDGKLIAFVVIEDSDVDLYIMDTDGSAKRNLNIKGGAVGTFNWIDNDRIVYDAGTETSLSVGVVSIGSGNSDLIASGGFNMHPSFHKDLK